ncbi:hypothetical protein F4776DRAFT_229529 [Hypoxylon sp. NC0597]|nr:hypothetical protein F4776DRAFT_229529 [Hypoxylon sp. NC0597]
MCQHSLSDFDRKLTQLIVLSDELNQKIKLNSRYKDSVRSSPPTCCITVLIQVKLSTVLSLEDSRNSIRQNSTIQKLTYLTIGYLPLGLISAIFAIPSEQNVIIPAMGLGGFVVSVVGLFIITFTIAVFIEPIQVALRRLRVPRPSSGGGGGPGSWLPEMRRYLSASSSESEDLEQGKLG